ncbi:unnamed protein product [Caretta caretta]
MIFSQYSEEDQVSGRSSRRWAGPLPLGDGVWGRRPVGFLLPCSPCQKAARGGGDIFPRQEATAGAVLELSWRSDNGPGD